eukprot:8690126-Pyramimonas_sp.AAC.1
MLCSYKRREIAGDPRREIGHLSACNWRRAPWWASLLRAGPMRTDVRPPARGVAARTPRRSAAPP